jgi:hypothetical protein
MTGANTDKIQTPLWEVASGILLRLASNLFYDAIHQGEMKIGDPIFEHWHALRSIAVRYLENRSTLLQPFDRERMIGALKFVHEFQHSRSGTFRGWPIGDVESCLCSAAVDLRALALILAEEREVAIASNSL